MAAPAVETPKLTEPVTFAGDDALRFVEELPSSLPRAEEDSLRDRTRAAEAMLSGTSANELLSR